MQGRGNQVCGRGLSAESMERLLERDHEAVSETAALQIVLGAMGRLQGGEFADAHPVEMPTADPPLLDSGVAVTTLHAGDQTTGVGDHGESADLHGEGPDFVTGRLMVGAVRTLAAHPIAESLDAHGGRTGTDDAKFFCGRIGKIDDTSFNKGAPIVDTNHRLAAVGFIVNLDINAQGKSFVGGGHGVHVVDFSVARALAVKIRSVPAGHPLLNETIRLPERIIAFAIDDVGLFITLETGVCGGLKDATAIGGTGAGGKNGYEKDNSRKSAGTQSQEHLHPIELVREGSL